MAGAGKKTFVAGEVLTAAQVNDYLMDQAVMRFADASARTASISVPTEGMVTYLDDTNRVEVYDGSAWQTVIDEGLVTAKGDLLVASASNSITALAVGSDGQVLTASAGAPSGLAWSTAAGAPEVTIEQLTSGTTWTKPTGVSIVEVWAIGGGGGGGAAAADSGNARSGGGGGAGGLQYASCNVSALASVAYTIGAGGAAAANGGNTTWGTAPQAFYISASGGGRGGSSAVGTSRGCGGGSGGTSGTTGGGGGGIGGDGFGIGGSAIQGTQGGNGVGPSGLTGGAGMDLFGYKVGGGGNAGGVTFQNAWGGGACNNSSSVAIPLGAAPANTGSGGGGANHNGSTFTRPGGAGGSGVIILRYLKA